MTDPMALTGSTTGNQVLGFLYQVFTWFCFGFFFCFGWLVMTWLSHKLT